MDGSPGFAWATICLGRGRRDHLPERRPRSDAACGSRRGTTSGGHCRTRRASPDVRSEVFRLAVGGGPTWKGGVMTGDPFRSRRRSPTDAGSSARRYVGWTKAASLFSVRARAGQTTPAPAGRARRAARHRPRSCPGVRRQHHSPRPAAPAASPAQSTSTRIGVGAPVTTDVAVQRHVDEARPVTCRGNGRRGRTAAEAPRPSAPGGPAPPSVPARTGPASRTAERRPSGGPSEEAAGAAARVRRKTQRGPETAPARQTGRHGRETRGFPRPPSPTALIRDELGHLQHEHENRQDGRGHTRPRPASAGDRRSY